MSYPSHPRGQPRSAAWFAMVIGVLAGACDPAGLDDEQRRIVESTVPDVAVDWNALAVDIAYAEDQFLTFKGQRALAMMHLAMHDALQAIVPVYAAYAYDGVDPGADPAAAAARAAHDVLLDAYPERHAVLAAELAKWTGSAAADGAPPAGEDVGAASARAIVDMRTGDGWDAPGTYTFRDGPGAYRTTPPWDGFTLQPGFRRARPFSFTDPAGFRPPPPPALESAEYAAALSEVRVQGDSMSTVRTADETGYAVWWMEFAESSVSRLARRLLAERAPDLWQANRVLAHLHVALFDGYISNWDSKYEFNHWRPYTAIRNAADDGNPATDPDHDWRPLRPTPPFPEYASAHATGCAAAYEVMAWTFGADTPFENTSLTAPPGMPTRSFASFGEAADECADSRVHIGWHYRYAVEAGQTTGIRIAQYVIDTMLPRR